MHSIDLEMNIHNIFFVGIGGISMSGLAEILFRNGYQVSGSDRADNAATKHLRALGVSVHTGHDASHITKDLDLVVHTAAVKADNPEIKAARALGLPVIDRAALLGRIMRCFTHPIAVAGTHGKTTTTAMIAEILLRAGLDPSISIGGSSKTIGGNNRWGDSEYFVVESCEYFDSFLQFDPYVGVILNIDCDHMDYFKTMDNMQASFLSFAKNISTDGALVIYHGVATRSQICEQISCRAISYDLDNAEADVYAGQLSLAENGCYAFTIYENAQPVGPVHLRVHGRHNVLNALAAYAVCTVLGVPKAQILEGLAQFDSTKRRYETKGFYNGATVVDDYAHHPTEMRAVLQAGKETGCSRLLCVFQPHTYSRTKALLTEIADSLCLADFVGIVDIYSAREDNDGSVHASDIVTLLVARGVDSKYFSSFSEAEDYLRRTCIPNDLLITMGAGDIDLLGESLLRTDL